MLSKTAMALVPAASLVGAAALAPTTSLAQLGENHPRRLQRRLRHAASTKQNSVRLKLFTFVQWKHRNDSERLLEVRRVVAHLSVVQSDKRPAGWNLSVNRPPQIGDLS